MCRASLASWFLLAICALAVSNASVAAEIGSVKNTLVIGKVSDNPKKHYRYLKPMVDYAVAQMGDLGITEGRVLMARDNDQMVEYLKSGRVDWVTETPFSAVVFEERAGAEILLRKWKKGVPEYRTLFVTRKDSPINALADLRGRVVAFEDPGSTTAFFVPASMLLGEGHRLVRLDTPRDRPGPDEIGYVFAYEEINIATWVAKDLVDAGAYSNLDWDKKNHTPRVFREQMRVFDQTQTFPRAVEVVRKDLAPEIKERLIAVLLAAADDPEARPILKKYQKTTKFDELDEATRSGLEEVRRLAAAYREGLR